MKRIENDEFIKYSGQLKLETISPLHIGNGKFLNPNSSLLEERNGELTIKNSSYVSNENAMEIAELVNTGGIRYIPGSSIKGALRSAFLYNWLNSQYGGNQLKQWLEKLTFILNGSKNNKKKDIDNEFKNLIENKCFGGRNNFKIWNNLRVRDANGKLSEVNSSIYELRRYYLLSDYDGIPTFLECMTPGNLLNTQIQYVNSSSTERISRDLNNTFKNQGKICQLINNFTKDVLDYEIKVLGYDDVETTHILGCCTFLNDLSQQYNNIDKENEFYIRLGAGKMQFYQTIAIAIFNLEGKDETENEWISNAWNDYKYFLQDFKEVESDLFPITRMLTWENQRPLGWVKGTFKKT